MFTLGKSWCSACAAGWLVVAAIAPGASRAEAAAEAPGGAATPIVLAKPASFEAAVAAIEHATGARPTRLHGRSACVPPAEGRAFQLDSSTATRLVDGSREPFRKAGLFLFRHERSFGLADEKDVVGVLATADWHAAVRRIGTAGVGGALADHASPAVKTSDNGRAAILFSSQDIVIVDSFVSTRTPKRAALMLVAMIAPLRPDAHFCLAQRHLTGHRPL